MYRQIKSMLFSFLPKPLLFRYEPLFRRVYYQWYRGNRFICNICRKGLRKFILLEDGDRLCPNCGSIARNRRLWQILEADFLKKELKVLDFSPSRCLFRAMKNKEGLNYISTDLSGDFLAEKKLDITQINEKSEAFDLILCYHVLEHIEEDEKAIRELYRILRPAGTCLIQTPFKEGEIYEDSSIGTAAARLRHFGQEDHVRIYSVAGLQERLTKCGFKIRVQEFSEKENNKHGWAGKETVLICTK